MLAKRIAGGVAGAAAVAGTLGGLSACAPPPPIPTYKGCVTANVADKGTTFGVCPSSDPTKKVVVALETRGQDKKGVTQRPNVVMIEVPAGQTGRVSARMTQALNSDGGLFGDGWVTSRLNDVPLTGAYAGELSTQTVGGVMCDGTGSYTVAGGARSAICNPERDGGTYDPYYR